MKSIIYAFLVKLYELNQQVYWDISAQPSKTRRLIIKYKKGHKDKDLYDQKDQREKMIKR